tara:strand:- start:144 stop:1166 length:1023 start_codon:yes stop_codon:yes gene_type:complete
MVSRPHKLEPEDVPPVVSMELPGPSLLVEVTLEPAGASDSARKMALKTARAIASAMSGVVEDPQSDTRSLPRGVKRFVKPRREERFSQLTLSWWYADSPLRSVEGVRRLFSIFERHVPEAVPHRYGLYEPLQYKTADAGLDELSSFLCENIDESPMFRTTRPVVDLHIADCGVMERGHLGFKSNLLDVSIEVDVLKQPGWAAAVRSLWREVSAFLGPFYGEARVTAGHLWEGATSNSDLVTDVHPVRSWWWRGIPPKPGVALVLGAPYSDLWKPPSATTIGGLAFVEPNNWGAQQPLATEIPDELAQRWMPSWTAVSGGGHTVNWCNELPPCWPFANDLS